MVNQLVVPILLDDVQAALLWKAVSDVQENSEQNEEENAENSEENVVEDQSVNSDFDYLFRS